MVDIAVRRFCEEPAWHDAFARSGTAEGSLAWFRTLASTTLAPGEEAVVLEAKDGAGAPLAILPLVRKGRALRALTAPYTTRFAPALPEVDLAHLVGRRAAEFVDGVLQLDALDCREPSMAAFAEGLEHSGLAVARYRHFGNWYEPVCDFDDYWRNRPSRLRTTVRRKLNQAPAVEFRCARSPAELAAAFTGYEEVYRSSWKVPEPHAGFMPAMVKALGDEGLVRLGTMSLAGDVVAAQIWLLSGAKATIFKLAHRESAAAHSPGTLLTHWTARELIANDGIREIDFGRGDDAYKRDWLRLSRPRFGLVATNMRSFAGMAALLRQVLPTKLARLIRGQSAATQAYE
ncbi:MAG: GNAT family N-acetyltransferase [Alphaproteobacteria bacterium]|nr:GNAT family N-acetyltransferase [Alphaproteobacteria bacterium]